MVTSKLSAQLAENRKITKKSPNNSGSEEAATPTEQPMDDFLLYMKKVESTRQTKNEDVRARKEGFCRALPRVYMQSLEGFSENLCRKDTTVAV